MSVYETEQQSRKQGFYFACELVLPRWQQYGHVMWSTEEEAERDGRRSVSDQRCSTFRIRRVSLYPWR